MVRVAAAQMRVSEHMKENYQASLRFICAAAEAGAQLVCFPEGQLTNYIPQYQGLKSENFAIAPDHPYVQGFCDACRENHILASVALNLAIDGNVVALADDTEQLLVAELDFEAAKKLRAEKQYLSLRRSEVFEL